MGVALTVLDAYAVVAYIAGEGAGDEVNRLRSRKGRGVRISTANLAEAVEEPLATPDPALATMARAEGVKVVALPDSRGRRPTG